MRDLPRFLHIVNFVCFLASSFFFFATVYVWREEWVLAHTTEASTERESETGGVRDESDGLILSDQDRETLTADNVDTDKNLTLQTTDNPLPREINLPVPFTSQAPEKQWEKPWQDACEEAAVLMLDAYYKHYGLSPLFARDEIKKLVIWEEDRGWETSISIDLVRELAEDHIGRSSREEWRIVTDPTIDDIKLSIAKGNPVLVVADGRALPNPHFRNGGPVYHALIVRGYTEDSFVTNDPGTQFGENFVYRHEDLMSAIRDWNQGEVQTGQRVVLFRDEVRHVDE